MEESNISKDFNEKYLESYRQEQSDPTNENHHFDSNTAAENGEVNNPATTAAAQLAESTFKPSDVMAFGYPVMDFIHARLPNGATEGSRHNTAIKLAYDLMLICDADTEKVRMLMLQLQWVNDITTERGIKELDDILDAAKKLMHKRESETLGELLPSREMRRAIKQVTQREYKLLVRAVQQAMSGVPGSQDDIVAVLEQIGRKLERFFKHYPLLRLLCYGLKRKHYIAALFVGGAFAMNLMTRCWYQWWAAPGKKCRLNHLLELIGRQGSGKRFVVELYEIMMEPIKKSDAPMVEALNRWKEERSQNNGAAKNKTPEPKGIYRCLPSESSAAGVRDAEVNAKEIIDGEEISLHISQFDSELQNTLDQMKKGYFSALYTLWLKGFHNEPHGALLKSATSKVGEWPVHYNCEYTGTQHALDQQVNLKNYPTGLNGRITAVPMGNSNFEMMDKVEFTEEHRNRNKELSDWAYRLNDTKGEIPCRDISDALYDWTARRMEDAKEDQSLALEDLLKRPNWHGANYSLPFIVSRHWDQMVEDNGKYKCGPDFKTDKIDRELALLITNAVFTFQKYFFLSIAEQHYDNEQTAAASNQHHQQKTLLAYRRLPDPCTPEDIDREYGYNGVNGSIYSRLKRLQDDGLLQKIRSGEDKGKYKKLA